MGQLLKIENLQAKVQDKQILNNDKKRLISLANLNGANLNIAVFRCYLNPSVVFAEPFVLRADSDDEVVFFAAFWNNDHEPAVLSAAASV